MSRTPRQASETGYYHVITRGNQRQAVFHDAEDYQTYCRLASQALTPPAVHVSHFCLMPNHAHLLLYAHALAALSRAMHQLQRTYWFYVKRQRTLSGHLWQGRFHSFPIATDAYLLEAARYIERNPLEANLIEQWSEYPWSSYRFYTAGEFVPLPLTPTPCYLALGSTATVRQARYRHFVDTPQPYDKSMRRKLRLVTSYA